MSRNPAFRGAEDDDLPPPLVPTRRVEIEDHFFPKAAPVRRKDEEEDAESKLPAIYSSTGNYRVVKSSSCDETESKLPPSLPSDLKRQVLEERSEIHIHEEAVNVAEEILVAGMITHLTAAASAPEFSSHDVGVANTIIDSIATSLSSSIGKQKEKEVAPQSHESITSGPSASEYVRQQPVGSSSGNPGAYPVSGASLLSSSVNPSVVTSSLGPSPRHPHSQSQTTGHSELSMTADTAIVATVVDHYERGGSVPCRVFMKDRRVWSILFVSLLIILGLLAAIVILGLDRSRISTMPAINQPVSTVTQHPSSRSPSKAPLRLTNAPTSISQSVVTLISDAAPDRGAHLFNETSPQFAALEWLLQDPLVRSYTDAKLLQRYALATLAFSVVPSGSRATSNPIFGSIPGDYGDECNWTTSIQCNGGGLVSIIDFSYAAVHAYLPSELVLLEKLESLQLTGNQFHRGIPSVFSRLQQLTDLALYGNYFTGTLPTELGRLSRLRNFDVGANQFSGTIPFEYGKMTALQRLILNDNVIFGTIPTEIASIKVLTDFEIYHNFVTGSIPTEIGLLKSVNELDFALNELNGTIPSEIENMAGLRTLKLHDNRLTGEIPRFPSLIENIQIYRNKFVGSVPGFWLLQAIDNIQLNDNLLNGTVPTELGILKLGGELNLENNNLTGTIPSELGRLRKMMGSLNLGGNNIYGTIPTQLGFLTNLGFNLILSSNNLNGTIPSELGNLIHLRSMYLHNNPSLGGTLPTQFGRLSALVELMIYGTALNGTVPAAICNLTDVNLTDIYLNCDVACACCQKECY